MDLRHARTFVTVAELGTVSKAAERLHTAQPALSRQISNLEQELGLKLFDRVGRRLVLTSDGEQLLGDFRSLLSYASAVGERARSCSGEATRAHSRWPPRLNSSRAPFPISCVDTENATPMCR